MNDRSGREAAATDVLRELPSIDEALQSPHIAEAVASISRELALEFLRERLEALRAEIRGGRLSPAAARAKFAPEALARALAERVAREQRVGLVRAVNATGVVLHTGLGRAPIHPEAARAMGEIAQSYGTLEIDRESGERNQRDDRIATLCSRLLGVEAAIAVNNNAAATVLALAAFSRGQETILSRGELVEIGGSFRMPDVMLSAGAILREVGTTNRTRIADYRSAIGANTGLLLKVHTSNFRVQGFVEDVSPKELAALGAEHAIPSVYDLGSGLLDAPRARALDMLGDEPNVQTAIESGVDLVTFSGDKLLGGPQAGLLVGRAQSVARCRKNPLYRAMRLDKVSIAGLETTLELLLAGRGDELPTRAMLCADPAELARAAERIAERLSKLAGFAVSVAPSTSQPGSGSAPEIFLPTSVVRVSHAALGPNALEHALRIGDPAVFARVHDGAVLLDPRTLLAGDEQRLIGAFERIAAAR